MLVGRSIPFGAELKNRECRYTCSRMVRALYTGALYDTFIPLLHNEGGATTRYR